MFQLLQQAADHELVDAIVFRHETSVRELVPDVIASAETTAEVLPFVDPAETLTQLHVEESDLRRRMTEMERRLADLTGGHP